MPERLPYPDAFLLDGPAGAAHRIVLAHGAGAPMDDAFLEAIAQGLARRGVRVARFEFPYMARRRAEGRRLPPDREPVLLDAWRAAVRALREAEPAAAPLAIGGKSLGGRMASLVADGLGARALVCLGYPFHPPGRPERLRTAHLARLRTPSLVVQGTRDPFGGPDEVAGYALSPAVRVVWIEDGDHSLAPRRASGRTRAQNLEAAVGAVEDFLASLDR
jgi:hypothetical protein